MEALRLGVVPGVDTRLEQICSVLKKSGIDLPEMPLPELEVPHLGNTGEEQESLENNEESGEKGEDKNS